MKRLKKNRRTVSAVLMYLMALPIFAQTTDARSSINSMLSTWLLPVCGLLILGGFIALVIHNQEALRGKNGLSKQDGWQSVGEGLIYVVLAVAAIGFVANKVASMHFSI